MAKKGQIFRKHSPEFKISVILDMREHHLGLMETSKKYEVDHHSIARWERIYLEEGAEGLMKERRCTTVVPLRSRMAVPTRRIPKTSCRA